MKRLLIILALFTFITNTQGQKKSLDHLAYNGWQSIAEKYISNNGQLAVYSINPQEGDGMLVIQQSDGEKLLEIPRGYNAKISEDNRYVFLKIKPNFQETRAAKINKKKTDELPKDSFGIVTISTLRLEKFARVRSYKLPEKSADWLAWQYEKPLADTTKKNEVLSKEKKDAMLSIDAETASTGDEKKDEGTWLFLRNLKTGNTDSIAAISEYIFDKHGTALVIESTGSKKDSIQPSVIVCKLAEHARDTILKNFNDAKNYVWDDAGKQLAFVAERDSSSKAMQKFYKLWYYVKGNDSAQLLANRFTKGVPENWCISENAELQFSKTGQRLFLGTAPILPPKDTSLPEFERVNVDVWNYKDDDLQSVQLKNLDKDLKKSYSALWNCSNNQLVQLSDEQCKEIQLTQEGDGAIFYTSSDFGKRIARQWQGYTLSDVYAVNAINGERKLIISNFKGSLYPSYTGKYLLLYNEPEKAYSVYNSNTGKLYKVASDIKVPLYDEENDVPDDPAAYGIIKWMEDDRYVLVYDRYDVWKVDPENKSRSTLVTEGRSDKIQYRYLSTDPEEKFIKIGQDLLFKRFNEKDKTSGLKEIYTSLPFQPLEEKSWMEKVVFGQVLKARDTAVYLFTKENYTSSPDLYSYTFTPRYVDLNGNVIQSGHCQKLSSINPQQTDYLWGNAELFTWKAYTGKQTEGILYKPDNFDPQKKYPMIVYFYERNNQTLYNYLPPAPTPSRLNIPFFVSRGYVVFVPDIWYQKGHPGKSAYDYIVSGTRALIKQGFIDSTKIGLQGQSWGGYQTAYLITQTKLFAAAWAGAPVVNMFSAYGGIRWESGYNRQMQYEHQQSRIGATIWQRPDLYVENSPLFHLPKVTTPLVIMSNDADGAVPWYQGIEFFTAMRRLDKPVWLLNYNGEAHNLVERRNRKDIQIREQQFFDWLLKGEKPPKWITDGVPAIYKGRTWGL